MGRKIPGKKHKGVNDPDKQRAEKFKLIKDKINAPPTNPDEQPISKSLQNLIELKNKVRQNKKIKKTTRIDSNDSNTKVQSFELKKNLKRLKPKNEKYVEKPVKPAANFARLPGESDRSFLGRVNKTVRDYLKEAEFENKFGVDIVRDKNTGEIQSVDKRPKDELEELVKKAKKHKKKKKNGLENGEPRLTKTQKRKKKLLEKKQKRELARIDEFAQYQDEIKFGEIAHAPPSLTVPKKISQTSDRVAPRPGQKPLLLKEKIYNTPSAPNSVPQSLKSKDLSKKSNAGVINKKGKRKALPVAIRRQLETVQSEVMKAYRNLKKM